MAYLDEKMQKLSFPTLTTMNWYAYFPDNGDALTDVLATGYFTNCRYINTEYGWANGIIMSILDDGFYFLQVGSTEVTATQVSAGGGEIPAIEADITALKRNVRDFVQVDMDNDDYTLTDEESMSPWIALSSVGDGTKTLTFPTATDGIRPAITLIYTPSQVLINTETNPGTVVDTLYGSIHFLLSTESEHAVKISTLDGFDAIKGMKDVLTVNMANDDCTLTSDEASSAVLIISNEGNGTKTLTWPTGITSPAQQLIVTLGCTNYFAIAHADGGVTADLKPGGMHIVSVTSTYGAYDTDEYVGIDTRSESNGVTTLAAGNTNLADSMAGKLLIAADGAAQTLTINTGLITPNMKLTVYCSGAGGMTITAGTATVNGNAVLAAGDSCVIYRDDLTNTYTCV